MKTNHQKNLEYLIEEMEKAIKELENLSPSSYYFPLSIKLEMENNIKRWKKELYWLSPSREGE